MGAAENKKSSPGKRQHKEKSEANDIHLEIKEQNSEQEKEKQVALIPTKRSPRKKQEDPRNDNDFPSKLNDKMHKDTGDLDKVANKEKRVQTEKKVETEIKTPE